MKNNIRLELLNRNEVEEISKKATVVLPIAAIEQHGPHLPICTDATIVEEIGLKSCEQADSETYLAPVIPYGNSHHHFPFPALSLTSETVNLVIKDLLESLVVTGFKKIIILNSHGGNDELIRIAARDISKKHQVSIASLSYWTVSWDALMKEKAESVGKVPGHAGGFETSIMQVLKPDLVKSNSFPPERVDYLPKKEMGQRMFVQHPQNSVGSNGYSDDSRNASAEKGERFLSVIIREVVEAFNDFSNDNT